MHPAAMAAKRGKRQAAAGQAQGPALQALRAATRAAHEALEATLPLMSAQLTWAVYAEHLRRTEPLVAQLEAAVAHAAGPLEALGFDVAGRRRHAWLLEDLRHIEARLGQEGTARSLLPQAVLGGIKKHRSLAARMGLLYVLEGSTLGGQVLCRHLTKVLGARPEELRYFAGHARRTGPMWKESCALLETVLDPPGPRSEACAAATDAFGWFLAIGVP